MRITASKLKADKPRETWTIHHLTDVHRDDPDHASDYFDRRVKEIAADPKAVWFGGGDYGSLIVPGDKRFGSGGHLKGEWLEHLTRLPDFYIEQTVKWMQPIADKCIGLIAGNHEATIGKNYHRGVVAEIASRLGRPELYLGDRGWSILQWEYLGRSMSATVYGYHGWSAGRLKGRKALQAERDLGAWNADVFLLGHDHQPYADAWYTQEVYHSARNDAWNVRDRPRVVVNGGAWSHGQHPPRPADQPLSEAPGQSWLEGKNFRPQPPENPIILAHLDFGQSVDHKSGRKYKPASVSFEIRRTAETWHHNAA